MSICVALGAGATVTSVMAARRLVLLLIIQLFYVYGQGDDWSSAGSPLPEEDNGTPARDEMTIIELDKKGNRTIRQAPEAPPTTTTPGAVKTMLPPTTTSPSTPLLISCDTDVLQNNMMMWMTERMNTNVHILNFVCPLPDPTARVRREARVNRETNVSPPRPKSANSKESKFVREKTKQNKSLQEKSVMRKSNRASGISPKSSPKIRNVKNTKGTKFEKGSNDINRNKTQNIRTMIKENKQAKRKEMMRKKKEDNRNTNEQNLKKNTQNRRKNRKMKEQGTIKKPKTKTKVLKKKGGLEVKTSQGMGLVSKYINSQGTNDPKMHEGKRDSLTPPLTKQVNAADPEATGICGEVWLKAGETLVFASSNDRWKASCSVKFNAPEGSVITLSCPHFHLTPKGCRKESLTYKDPIPGHPIKKKHCGQDSPLYTTTTNMLLLKYKRKELPKTSCSRGFVCIVTVLPGTTTTPATTTPAIEPRPLCPTCGMGKITPPSRIVSGEDASPGEYPWMAQVYNLGLLVFCGGSLISNQWVMTAAHCFFGFPSGQYVDSPVEVVLGELMIASSPSPVFLPVMKVVVHLGYLNDLLLNDIALVQLYEPVTFTPNIAPICLAQQEDIMPGENNAIAAGWGRQGCGMPQPVIMKEVSVDLLDDSACRDFHLPLGIYIPPTQICASDRDEGDSPWLGDSGGPLMQQLPDGRWAAVGIVSFGAICDFGEPVVYTRVPPFIPWIKNTIGEAECA